MHWHLWYLHTKKQLEILLFNANCLSTVYFIGPCFRQIKDIEQCDVWELDNVQATIFFKYTVVNV